MAQQSYGGNVGKRSIFFGNVHTLAGHSEM